MGYKISSWCFINLKLFCFKNKGWGVFGVMLNDRVYFWFGMFKIFGFIFSIEKKNRFFKGDILGLLFFRYFLVGYFFRLFLWNYYNLFIEV